MCPCDFSPGFSPQSLLLGHVLTKLFRGWRFHGGNLYFFSQEKKPWDEAERFCVSQDSHLTSVSSQVEQVSEGTS